MTTNSVEAFNGVLVGARYLPIRALLQHTFLKYVQYLYSKRKNVMHTQTSLVMLSRVRERWDKCHRMVIYEFDHATGLAQVKRPQE